MRKTGGLKFTWAVTLIVALILLVTSSSVLAVENGGIGGKPSNPRSDNPRSLSIFVYELKPGQQVSDGVKIYNNTDQTKNIRVYATDSIISSGGAFACAQAADTIKEVGGWIKLDKNDISLSPKQSETIDFTVSVPNNAEPGEHNGCIAIQESKSNGTNVGNGIALSLRSAIRVAITIPGRITKELTYKGINFNLKKDKLVAAVLLRNNGNVSLDATIETSLQNSVKTIESVKGTYATLPKTVTELNFEFKRPFWGGLYRIHSTASYNSNQSQSLGQGQNNKSISYTSGLLFIMPQPGAAVVEILVLAAILVLIYLLYRKYWWLPRQVKQYKPYKVKKNDDIQSVAAEFHTNWKHLAKANKLKAPYAIKVGDSILVPSKRKKENTKNSQKDE